MSNVIHTQSKKTNNTIKIMEIKYLGKLFITYRNMLHRRVFKMLCMALDALL